MWSLFSRGVGTQTVIDPQLHVQRQFVDRLHRCRGVRRRPGRDHERSTGGSQRYGAGSDDFQH
jgi:hypothetical protein